MQALVNRANRHDNGSPWVFDHDFYLLINIAVGGRYSQPPDRATVFPQTMLIDYIRVYAT
jgi:beta-glucanase (GH16 family)